MTFKNTDKVLATSSQGGTRIRRVKHVSIGTGQNKQRENEKYNNKKLSQTFETISFPSLVPLHFASHASYPREGFPLLPRALPPNTAVPFLKHSSRPTTSITTHLVENKRTHLQPIPSTSSTQHPTYPSKQTLISFLLLPHFKIRKNK